MKLDSRPNVSDEFHSITVDLKDFTRFTSCHLIHPSDIVACKILSINALGIMENHSLVLYVYLGTPLGDESHGFGALTYCT